MWTFKNLILDGHREDGPQVESEGAGSPFMTDGVGIHKGSPRGHVNGRGPPDDPLDLHLDHSMALRVIVDLIFCGAIQLEDRPGEFAVMMNPDFPNSCLGVGDLVAKEQER